MNLLILLLIAVSFTLGYRVKTYIGGIGDSKWIDSVTGLPNRADFERAIAVGLKTRSKLGLIIIDLDNFKSVNDTQGHLVGDSILRAAASQMLQYTADRGTLFRWGGDEFVLLVPNGEERLDDLCRDIKNDFAAADFELTCSTGHASQLAGDTPATFFQRADQSLYLNKS